VNFAALVDSGPSAAELRQAVEQALPAAVATTNPMVSATSGMIETLVQLPLILHFDDPRQFAAAATIRGHSVRISAYADSFRWSAGEQVVDTVEAGAPYDEGHHCVRGDCPYYLTAPGFADTGQYPLSLSVRWSAECQVDDGPIIAIPDPIVITSPTLTIHARQARGVLISDPGALGD
jgi:hypothetical protein